MKLLLALLSISITLPSCKSFNPSGNKEQAALVYARPIAFVTTKSVFDFAVSKEDKAKKAEIVRKIALVIRTLSAGDLPAPSEFNIKLTEAAPDKDHWNTLVTALTQVYQGYHQQVIDGSMKRKYLSEILNKLASGCEDAAEAVLK